MTGPLVSVETNRIIAELLSLQNKNQNVGEISSYIGACQEECSTPSIYDKIISSSSSEIKQIVMF